MLDSLRTCIPVLSRRWKIIILFNLLFFSCVFASLLVVIFLFPHTSYGPPISQKPADIRGWILMFLGIFGNNLGLSVLFAVLPAFVFFPLSMAVPLYNAAVIGVTSYSLGDLQFLIILPILILEGEAMVLAATAGTILGCAWLKPRWVHGVDMPRRASFWETLYDETLMICFVVVLLWLIAAVVETVTIFLAT